MWIQFVLNFYAFFLILGGYIGFKKAKSKASLIMGIVSGLGVFYGVWMMSQESKYAHCVTGTIAALLIVVFGIRLIKTKKVMPAGMLLVFSVGALIVSLMYKGY